MVSLNFNRADLVEIIHIIAQQLRLTYTIDPEVKGTVTINNPFGTTFSDIGIRSFLDQGSITNFDAGRTTLSCASQLAGKLAPGTCTISFTLRTRNPDGTIPAWTLGAATFRLQVTQNNVVLDEESVVVRLTGLQ